MKKAEHFYLIETFFSKFRFFSYLKRGIPQLKKINKTRKISRKKIAEIY